MTPVSLPGATPPVTTRLRRFGAALRRTVHLLAVTAVGAVSALLVSDDTWLTRALAGGITGAFVITIWVINAWHASGGDPSPKGS